MRVSQRHITLGLVTAAAALSALAATTAGSWRVAAAQSRVVARPTGAGRSENVAVYVTCVAGTPQFAIKVRDAVAPKPDVTLQFGGQSGRAIVFVGRGGIIRTYKGFVRGADPLLAIASPRDSNEIVTELLRGHSRLAWMVDTAGNGLDSLEVSSTGFASAWKRLHCGSKAD